MLRQLGTRGWVVGIALMGLLLGFVAACEGEQTPSDSGSGDQNVEAQALLQERCTQCHGLDRVTSQSKTAAEWQQTVDSMVARGAQLNAEETEVLVAYLAEAYGQ